MEDGKCIQSPPAARLSSPKSAPGGKTEVTDRRTSRSPEPPSTRSPEQPMPNFEFSRFDGSQQFAPQSAAKLVDELSRYLRDCGDHVLKSLEEWEDEPPDVLEMLIRRGYVEKDAEGKYVVTPRGVRRVESRALEDLFQIARKDQLGRHETEFRGAGQTLHEESKPYEYGDPVSNLNMHETLRNALYRQGGGSPVHVTEDDLVVYDTHYQTSW